jgi:hypothetical protein
MVRAKMRKDALFSEIVGLNIGLDLLICPDQSTHTARLQKLIV